MTTTQTAPCHRLPEREEARCTTVAHLLRGQRGEDGRLVALFQLLGEPERAVAAHRRLASAGLDTPEEITAAAWAAAAHCARGALRQAQGLVRRTVGALERCSDPYAVVVARTTASAVAATDGRCAAAEHHRQCALQAAGAAGDPLLRLMSVVGTAQQRIEQGEPREVLAELDSALGAARQDAALAVALMPSVRCRRAAALLAMGELDRSAAEFTGALTDYHRLGDGAGLALGAPALLGVGDVHRERGELGPARTAYQEAVVLAERSGDRQTLSAALTGLALSRGGGDPHSAAVLASRAALGCAGPPRIRALLAGGWIALTAGRCEAAAEAARQAAGEPGAQGSRAVFAELLELEAMCAVDPATRQALLGDAEEMWATAQRPMAVARVALARAQLEGAGATRVREATAWLGQFGVGAGAGDAAGLLNRAAASQCPAVTVRVLGGFQVLRDGCPVGAEQWQSKKARDLLKLLVARRGLPTPRELLMEELWPEQDPARCANRLSVALSVLRLVLDPQRRMAQDHFIVADNYVVGLARLHVDVQEFLAAARHALGVAGRSTEHAFAALAAAEGLYRGDVLADEPYAQWATALREEAQAAHAELLARLAAAAAENRDAYAEIHYRLRLLERDPYDEDTHLALVRLLAAASRHGEARRRYRMYAGCMEEIDVVPAPFPVRQIRG
ncbi:BTAD domain-containing putative transcriptional regulator [Streptomyces sp. MUSC 14]|uniref:BTAD domain-containing putative transcriptional regulator n=1 Tax=Streptomyces sp. MUSC 14 TaxID=1354889 RepID=UPI000AE69FD6|nr:BTAD domain-containing putative transcriptional regulator [Streptomyces sp. MUSC 14]